MNIVEVKNLRVRITGKTILKDINIVIENRPQVIALIGPNGAGKTTLIHSILGLQKIARGSITLSDSRKIAYCPDTPEFDENLTAIEVMELSAYLVNQRQPKSVLIKLLKEVGLENNIYRIADTFSRGMKQRLGIAACLLMNPKLLFLDEPTSALDPIGKQEMLDIIERLSKSVTVVISSHELNEVQPISSAVIVLNQGKLIYSGNVNRFIDVYSNKNVSSVICKDSDSFNRLLSEMENERIKIINSFEDKREIRFESAKFKETLKIIVKLDGSVKTIEQGDQSLANAFRCAVERNLNHDS